MRKYVLTFLGVCMLLGALSGCASSAERAAAAAEHAQKVLSALADRHYKINITHMHPLRGGSRTVSSFSLEVKGDTLISYLPYFGRVYWVPYGGGKGLNFMETISSYEEWEKKNGLRHIEIGLKNEEDTYLYTIEVFSNGSATIDVMARQREQISYTGEMDVK